MFTAEAQTAILDLQRRATKSHDSYTLERIDRALDEIVRNPLNSAPAPFQVRSALAHAGEIMKNRRALAPTRSLDDPSLDVEFAEPGYAEVEMMRWLDDAAMSAKERTLLRVLMAEPDVATLAEANDISAQRLRETISRTRLKGRTLYAEGVPA